ncbi:MAG: DUF4870 domain-containing protein [Defluviitaleaceae bacterium]|nr:DUF4870 domain-containing protein [Defluviitaleaceae bacterium]
MKKSVFDLNENIAAAISYVFGPVSGIVVLVLEKENKFVRFHALQSTLWFLLIMLIGWIVSFVGRIFSILPLFGILFEVVFGLAMGVISLIGLISLVWLAIQAYSNKTWKIPVIGDVAWKQVNK